VTKNQTGSVRPLEMIVPQGLGKNHASLRIADARVILRQVIHLLVAAGFIGIDDEVRLFGLEIRWRVVEHQMAVFSDACKKRRPRVLITGPRQPGGQLQQDDRCRRESDIA